MRTSRITKISLPVQLHHMDNMTGRFSPQQQVQFSALHPLMPIVVNLPQTTSIENASKTVCSTKCIFDTLCLLFVAIDAINHIPEMGKCVSLLSSYLFNITVCILLLICDIPTFPSIYSVCWSQINLKPLNLASA